MVDSLGVWLDHDVTVYENRADDGAREEGVGEHVDGDPGHEDDHGYNDDNDDDNCDLYDLDHDDDDDDHDHGDDEDVDDDDDYDGDENG